MIQVEHSSSKGDHDTVNRICVSSLSYHPFWKEMGDLVTWDMENVEALNDFFAQSSPASAPATSPKPQKAKVGTGRMKNHPL